uniref:Uncharacterized protein n=1 Tax=Arundo donax TaxID=35708 RepID=A0A0A8Y557_ARUDO
MFALIYVPKRNQLVVAHLCANKTSDQQGASVGRLRTAETSRECRITFQSHETQLIPHKRL